MSKERGARPITERAIRSQSDEQLGDLVRRVVGECHRRGDAATAALRAAIQADLAVSRLDTGERARIAEVAARREAERLREAEARRLAAEEAERVRREAEKIRQQEEETRRQAERLRALAQRARDLIGHDEAEYTVSVWSRGGERRVYIGKGYDATWVEYYHTGSDRMLPGTIKFPVAVDRPLAEHLGCTREEAKERIKAYCDELCREWRGLRLRVTEENAPRDTACRVRRWVLQSEKGNSFIGRFRAGDAPVIAGVAQEARKYRSLEEAEASLSAGRAEGGKYLDGYTAVERQVWLSHPPREED